MRGEIKLKYFQLTMKRIQVHGDNETHSEMSTNNIGDTILNRFVARGRRLATVGPRLRKAGLLVFLDYIYCYATSRVVYRYAFGRHLFSRREDLFLRYLRQLSNAEMFVYFAVNVAFC